MEAGSSTMVAAARLLVLNPREFELWKMRIEHVEQTYPPTTTEEKLARKNELKARVQLEILGETISQEDMNLKFLRSLPSEWKTHTLIWRNKPDLDTLSMDDLYNTNLKIYETEVKGIKSQPKFTNVAFVTSNNLVFPIKLIVSNSANIRGISDAVIFLLSNQSNNLQLNDEGLTTD
ncbi:hypothetical protein Tco_0084996 [Tanacetum coccineum]